MKVKMVLKYRSVSITEEEFKRDLAKAVEWKNLSIEHYVALWRHPTGGPLAIWAHDGIVKKIETDRIKLFNPGRYELSDCYQKSFGGYGTNWFLVKPSDYSGPKE